MRKGAIAKTTATIHGLRVTTSNYGATIPIIYGRARAAAKMVWANDWASYNAGGGKKGKSGGGGKKKGSSQGPAGYTVAANLLLGWRPITAVLAAWSDKDYFPVSLSTYTSVPTLVSGHYRVSLSGHVPGGNAQLVAVIAVEQNGLSYSLSVADYLGDGTTTASGVRSEVLVNSAAMRPSFSSAAPDLTRTYHWSQASPLIIFFDSTGSPNLWQNFPVTVYFAYAVPTGNSSGIPTSRFVNPQQFEWSGLGTGSEYVNHPVQRPSAVMAAKFIGMGCPKIDLGVANTEPNFSYELMGSCAYGTTDGDANPVDVLQDLFYQGSFTTIGSWAVGGDQRLPKGLDIYDYRATLAAYPGLEYLGDLTPAISWCRAWNIGVSLAMDSQQTARQVFQDLIDIANCAPVLSEGLLKLIPYDETSYASPTGVYIAPTSSGPVYDLDERDFLSSAGSPPVVFDRDCSNEDINNGQKILPDVVQLEYIERKLQYNTKPWSDGNLSAAQQFASHTSSVRSLHWITSQRVAQVWAAIQLKRNNTSNKVKIKFKLPARFTLLEAMDLVTLSEPKLGLDRYPARFTSIVENDRMELECEAEPYVWGMCSPITYLGASTEQVQQGGNSNPGSINPPIIFEPVPQLYGSGSQRELWLAASGQQPGYGGCQIFVSTDGGSTYQPLGTITGQSVMGQVYNADLPANADPDTLDTLYVDLSESQGTLTSVTNATADGGASLLYVEGGTGGIPYELIGYSLATAQGQNKYALSSYLRRSYFGAPSVGAGVIHQVSKKVALLIGGNLFKVGMPSAWIGTTLHFKFCAFNSFGKLQQDLSQATDYSYTVAGTVPGASSIIVTAD